MTRSRAAILVMLLAVPFAGCFHTSPAPESDAEVVSPRGVYGRVTTVDKRTVGGELLALTDTGYVLEVGGRIVFARYADVKEAEFDRVGPMTLRARQVPSERVRGKVRYLSRFPYGITDAALAALLSSAGQSAPDDLGTSPRT